MTLLLPLLLACWAPELAPAGDDGEDGVPRVDVIFVDGGIVVPADVEADGAHLPEDRVLVERAWSPGEDVEILGRARRVLATAPDVPQCVMLFRVGIGSEPPRSLAWAEPDGGTLRMERVFGDLVIVDSWQGQPVRSDPVPDDAELVPVPAGCPTESAAEQGVLHPDGKRIAVVEGPFQERSGDVGWRVAVYR
ncbi:MAG: hypothetical protein H6742_22165 [Alphaproteobacteria bacterium]|nr:hypothetical protein [Alphaproteobacteria bacterium]